MTLCLLLALKALAMLSLILGDCCSVCVPFVYIDLQGLARLWYWTCLLEPLQQCGLLLVYPA